MNQQNSFTTTAAYFDQAELDVALDQNCYRTIAAGILVIGLLGSLNTPTLDVETVRRHPG
jgi:hypothetical protein